MKLSYSKRILVWNQTDGKCWYCGRQTRIATAADSLLDSDDWFSVDHILPQIVGGTNDISNLLPSCLKCNRTKKDKTVQEFREFISRRAIGAPKFTEEQIDYLRQHGIELPTIPMITFWGERSRS